MAKKGKKQGGKVRKVITTIKAKGQPDDVTVKRQPEQPEPEEMVMPKMSRLPTPKIRLTPKVPKLR